MAEANETKMSTDDGTMWGNDDLPAAELINAGTSNILKQFNVQSKSSFLTGPGLLVTAAASGPYDKMRYILLAVRKIQNNFGVHQDAEALKNIMLKSPRQDTDAERFAAFTEGETGAAASQYLKAAASIFMREFDPGSGFRTPEKTPLRQLEKLRTSLGYQTWADFTEAIKEEFTGMTLGTISVEARGQGISDFIEKLDVLSHLQGFLNDLLAPDGDGNVSSWYDPDHVISVKSLLSTITAPEWLGATIADYTGDQGEAHEAFGEFGQWLQKHLNRVNSEINKKTKESRKEKAHSGPPAEHQTLTTVEHRHARHAMNQKLEAGASKQARHKIGGGHGYSYNVDRPLYQKEGVWYYGNAKLSKGTMENNFILTKFGPILADGLDGDDPSPMYCKTIHTGAGHVCGAPHPRYLCPTEKANRAYNRVDEYSRSHIIKKRPGANPGQHKKKKRAKEDMPVCKFHKTRKGCNKGEKCTWKHEGLSGAASGKSQQSVQHVATPQGGRAAPPPAMTDADFATFQQFKMFQAFQQQSEGNI